MFAHSNSKVTVTSVLKKHMLCRRDKSSVGDRKVSVLVSGRAAMPSTVPGRWTNHSRAVRP